MDPVAALKKQFVAGQGVKLTEHTDITISGDSYTSADRVGAIGLDAKGIAGVEVTRTPSLSAKERASLEKAAAKNPDLADSIDLLTERIYLVSTGKRQYVNGGLYSTLMPEHATWVGMDASAGSAAFGDQLVNVFEPATLKYLLATKKSVSGSQYRGSTTFGALYKVSPTFREQIAIKPTGKAARTVISWRLTLDPQKLVKRLAITWTVKLSKKLTFKAATVSRYTEWGTAVKVTAPPADQVVDIKALVKKAPEPPASIDRNYVSVPPDDDGNVQ
ncbi:hypothetical protein [Nonomuraea rhizosphaerae]|uniref:hypothetical protein n=1 Tax=Nonomuraea rhizosphaerae TaxID=2665663 RepID=UPI001C5F5297|nr:hypothetical protein [Nonomuraea rhizosphaerae]